MTGTEKRAAAKQLAAGWRGRGNEVIDLILRRASEDFNWSEISPTIFGAVFESTLNLETRRSVGVHYPASRISTS